MSESENKQQQIVFEAVQNTHSTCCINATLSNVLSLNLTLTDGEMITLTQILFSKQIFRYLFENSHLRGKGVPHRKIRTQHAVSLSYLFFIHSLLERFLQEKPAYDPLSINSINHAFAVDYVAVITYI